ncbi:MAG: hypothetical protein IJS15_07870 [Victivallales bacterium]|nr:hypothetical protein [Victivallales bacterium]
MKKILFMLATALTAIAAESIVPDAQGVGSGACSNPNTVWYMNGIDGRWLAVGQPNRLNRRDRVVFRFPIIKYMPQCKVKKATLRFDYTAAGEQKRDNLIEVEHFTAERIFISGKDLNSPFTDSVAQFKITVNDARNSKVEFDVTDKVNADLSKGFEFCAFRVRSITADTLGNSEVKSSYMTVENKSMKLIIEE